jgi:hypothetical protein
MGTFSLQTFSFARSAIGSRSLGKVRVQGQSWPRIRGLVRASRLSRQAASPTNPSPRR